MITNLNYLKTALECLEQGQTPVTELKILKTIQQVCEMNIERIETHMVDKMDSRLYNTNTDTTGATHATR